MSKISIIVPCYNVAEYLPRCLEALLAQTYSDWQAVCVDDGSTDNSFEILKSYAEKDNRIVAIHQDNHGVEWARATAMEHIDSPYIMFCDPDDWYEPEMCEKMITTLERENVDIVMCGTNIVGMEDYDMQKYFANMPNEGRYDASFEMIAKYNMVLWNRIYKKETLDKYQIDFPKDPNIRRGYDTSFIAKHAMCIKTIYFMHDRLYNYWQREDSLMHAIKTKTSKLHFDDWYGTKRVLEFAKYHNFYEKNKKDLFNWINKNILYTLGRLPNDQILENSLTVAYQIFSPYISDISKKHKKLWLIASGKNEKALKKYKRKLEFKLGPICIFKCIKEDSGKSYYLFEIPVFRKIKENSNKQIYLGKWCVYRKVKK